jgi:kinesin family member 15
MPDENVQVVCRVRPRNPRELRNSQIGGESFVQVDPKTSSIRVSAKGEDKFFSYDFSAGEEVTQEELFEVVGVPITNRCLEGYNGTILCYGQTGSGKTFTIFGDSMPERNRSAKSTNRGLVPRILEYLWNNIPLDCEFHPKCAFYEIYQEKIFDLLDPTNSSPLAVREDSKLGVYVEGCTEQTISSIDEAYEILSLGYRSRHVGETAMNRMSSRSHAIFQLTIEKKHVYRQNDVEINHVISSRFSLVDLAGSERQRDTQAAGTRLREAAVINKSLTCLGKVITELISQPVGRNKKRGHINYRDSKLTFLLRDSLGGNSKVSSVASSIPHLSCRLFSSRQYLPRKLATKKVSRLFTSPRGQ